jgi:GMP synthase (glutamine-hydrolysing)
MLAASLRPAANGRRAQPPCPGKNYAAGAHIERPAGLLYAAFPAADSKLQMPAQQKPVLILQLRPEDDTSDSEYQAILKYGGLEERQTRRMRIEKTGIPRLAIDDYAAIIVGGSPFDISTPQADKSEIQVRIEANFRRLFDTIVKRDFPFLGACSGCGLLGSYLDTPISRRYAEPVGAARVRLTEAGREDSLLAGFPEQIDVLCGHKEACDHVPPGATLLLTGDDCPVQMFRVGENVYATQFHPEGDGEGFTVRIHAYKHHGYFAPEQADALIEAVNRQDTPHARQILQRFVDRYAVR